MIRVRTLGAAEVATGERCITPDSAMMFGLALFLSVSAGLRVSRTRLLDMFWPGVPDDSRRHALRQLLYRLRRDGFAFAMDGEELMVAVAEVDSDVSKVLKLDWADTAGCAEVRSASTFLAGYDPALSQLYRDWLDELKSQVGAQYRRALLKQIEVARRAGKWNEVDEWARRCLDIDALNEEATLAHAESVAMSGSKAQALQIIDRYLDELGDRNRVIGLPAKVLRRRVSEAAPEHTSGDRERVPLIGRAREVGRLNDLLGDTLKGRSATLFMVGAAGIGKSRLAQELVTTAHMRGWRSCAAQLQATDAQRPLGVFVDLFAALLQLPGALGCAPSSLSQLKLLTEHDMGSADQTQRSQEAEAVQERLRRAAGDLLESVASEGPLVLVIDDIHWCDEASVRLLQHLLVKSESMPVFWMLAAREEGRHEAVRAALAGVAAETMRLAPLSPDSASELFGALSGPSDPSAPGVPAELTAAVTGGNPLFVLELARHVQETGRASSLPQSLRAVIRDRAGRLSPIAQHVLHTCAVLGRFSSVPRVAGVLEIGTPDLLASLQELDTLGIVGAHRDADTLSIHDLWREEILSGLLPAAEKLLHHRCGLVLEAECRVSRSPSMVWEAARHLLASGSESRALSLLEEAAQHQLDNGLPAEAARTFELAVEASTENPDRLRAMTGRIAALRRAADWQRIATAIAPAIELSELAALAPGRHSDLELLQTEAMWRTEANSCASLERSLTCALDGLASPTHRAEAALMAAIVADNLCEFGALERLNSMALNADAPTGTARGFLLGVRLIYESTQGCLDRARECGAELIDLERAAGAVRGLARALCFSCHSHRMRGEFDRAIAAAGEALELAENHKLIGEASSAADVVLSVHLHTENLTAASYWIQRSHKLVEQVGARYATAGLAFNQAIYHLMVDEPARAAHCIAPYAENHFADPIVRQRMLVLSILARLAMASGDLARLQALAQPLKEALRLRRRTGPHDFHVGSYALLLDALGERAEAIEYVKVFIEVERRDRTKPSAELRALIGATKPASN